MIPLHVLLIVGGIEIIVAFLFAVIVYGFCHLTEIEVEDNPRRKNIRRIAIGCEYTVFSIIIISMVIWGLYQLIFVKYTILPCYPLLICSALFLILALVFFKKMTGCFILLLFTIQFLIFCFFSSLGESDSFIEKEYIHTVEIQYVGTERLSDVGGDYCEIYTDFIDFYYFTRADNTRTFFSSEDYDVKVVYDVPQNEEEYYNYYKQTEITIVKGSGIFSQSEINPLIEFHVHQ